MFSCNILSNLHTHYVMMILTIDAENSQPRSNYDLRKKTVKTLPETLPRHRGPREP